MVQRVLCTTEFDKESKRKGEDIRSAVLQALQRFDVRDCITNFAFVTCRDTNGISAMQSLVRLKCAAF